MKFLYKTYRILIMGALLLLSSCTDWFVIPPENKITSEDFWISEDAANGAVAGVYNKFRNITTDAFILGELRGDLFEEGDKTNSNQLKLMNGQITTSNTYTKWDKFYSIINNANVVIQNLPTVVELDENYTEDEMLSHQAEMVFVRSVCYFYLTRIFKAAPFTREGYESDDVDFYLAQTSQTEILANLVEDLNEAQKYALESYDAKEFNKGRATVWAHKALLADIYLWQGEYAKAISECNDIISSRKFPLLSAEYWFLNFFPGNANESIFELQYDARYDQTNGLNITGTANNNNVNYRVSGKMMFMYELADMRGFDYGFEYQQSSLLKFIANSVGEEITYRSNQDANWIYYRYAEIFLIKAEAEYELGNPNALNSINEIKLRANAAPLTALPDIKLDWYKELLDERAREFAGEGKRWFDLLRIAMRDFETNKELIIGEALDNIVPNDQEIIESKLNQQDYWYFPVNENEIRKNPNLVQNPYYAN